MRILMVCLGNICRSPMAQAIMESLVREKGLDWIIDSAGTNGLHDGESPDVRAIEEIKRRGLKIGQQRSRKIQKSDGENFDLILTMDYYILNECKKIFANKPHLKIECIMNFVSPSEVVEDPYYDGSFDKAFDKIESGCRAILHRYLKHY
ncbi:MAG: low molecular weight phosphotyrosine protein phosphatase [Saprospiraceae bacterium]|nr:low molecular weight phosphotyrosine protein phosphatase [Candidatus Vicinibacter proximus]MBL7822324.1 low molecular weight phosphotyrosine protein phosphatase [Saprospiraceae bacterium]MCC6843076.1 low molecular weight phosphotyrosine protein phosphatase [Saprospiraceae bacterium]HRG31974.1 low molecular weight protein-tyrosine-phosphatase [Saprospiraceae bacterium]